MVTHRLAPIARRFPLRSDETRTMGAWRAWYDACRSAGAPVRLSATAAAAGLDPSTVRRRANRDGFWRPFPDVIGPPGVVPDADDWCRAALLYLGADDPDTVAGVTRNTALWLHGISVAAPRPRSRRSSPPSGPSSAPAGCPRSGAVTSCPTT
jgi:hypothetical protein